MFSAKKKQSFGTLQSVRPASYLLAHVCEIFVCFLLFVLIFGKHIPFAWFFNLHPERFVLWGTKTHYFCLILGD